MNTVKSLYYYTTLNHGRWEMLVTNFSLNNTTFVKLLLLFVSFQFMKSCFSCKPPLQTAIGCSEFVWLLELQVKGYSLSKVWPLSTIKHITLYGGLNVVN